MHAHHQETIQRVTDYFQAQPQVLAVILGGSIAHGFAQPNSDVDVLIVVSDEEHQQRLVNNNIQFVSTDLATYAEGYIDGKYISPTFLAQVEQRGSEPARFAFADGHVLFSKLDDLPGQLRRIARYPVEHKVERIKRFYAQLEAWYWYAGEGHRKRSHYLAAIGSSKLLLFGGRMLLAHNELLYPYHKWFLAVLERAPHKPEGIVEAIQALGQAPTPENITAFYNLIKDFRVWEADWKPGETLWANHFMRDSELNWLEGPTPIEDL